MNVQNQEDHSQEQIRQYAQQTSDAALFALIKGAMEVGHPKPRELLIKDCERLEQRS